MSQVCVSHRVTWVFQSFSFPLIQANVSRRGSPKVCVLPYPPGEKISSLKTNSSAPANGPSRKEIHLPTIDFQGLCRFQGWLPIDTQGIFGDDFSSSPFGGI